MAPPAPAPASSYDGGVTTQSAAPSSNYAPTATAVNPNADATMWGISGPKMLYILRFVHICVGIFIAFAGIYAFVQGKSESSTVIAALYTIFLGTILFCSDLRIPKFDDYFRSNFGFLYGFKGKAFFLVFAAVFPLSLGNVGITAGCCGIFASLFDVYVLFKHPFFSSAKSAAEEASAY